MGSKADYGSGHPNFIKYKEDIVNHEIYKDMPDLIFESGEIQWETPSNRKSGAFKDSHLKRKNWWEKKAQTIGISPTENFWISKTAKNIHPTKMKACISCGEFMDIQYSYPTKNLIKRIKNLEYIEEDFEVNSLEHVTELLKRLYLNYSDRIFEDFNKLFTCSAAKEIPIFNNLDEALDWITQEYIPKEPSMLSPGAMSNAPDRLDGFHTLNLCCRADKDTGRNPDNLSSYSTDRRAFEYWVDGDWIAADRLMGLIRSDSEIREMKCLNNHLGPCAADHIGPISLGFKHRPAFQLLCNYCNSSKNNRMTFSDVRNLIDAESTGEVVTSWYASHLWNLRKHDVDSNETALRLSKMLRDNRHTAMHILFSLYQKKHLVFLGTFLGLNYAEKNITFENIDVTNHIVKATPIITERQQSYSSEQKIRRIRIGFQALGSYAKKENRNASIVTNEKIEETIKAIDELLSNSYTPIQFSAQASMYEKFKKNEVSDHDLQEFLKFIPSKKQEPTNFINSKELLFGIMQSVGQHLSDMWLDDRYVRSTIESLE